MIKKFRMALFVFITPFLISISYAQTQTNQITALTLLEDCRVALDVLDKNFGYVQIESEYLQGVKTGICKGYILSISEILCPISVDSYSAYSIRDLIAIVTKYLKDHPQLIQLKASTLVLKALEQYFPCKKLSSSKG